jgi:hypothetical protein
MNVNPKVMTWVEENQAAQGVTDFKVLVGTTKGGPYPLVFDAGLNLTEQVSALGLADGVYYAVTVAVNAAGTSDPSNEIEFQILKVPSAPVNFTVA